MITSPGLLDQVNRMSVDDLATYHRQIDTAFVCEDGRITRIVREDVQEEAEK